VWNVVCPDVDVVIIHDAVRPTVDEQCVLAVADAAFKHGVRYVVFCSWLTIFYTKHQTQYSSFCTALASVIRLTKSVLAPESSKQGYEKEF